jgi:hypothetical protein
MTSTRWRTDDDDDSDDDNRDDDSDSDSDDDNSGVRRDENYTHDEPNQQIKSININDGHKMMTTAMMNEMKWNDCDDDDDDDERYGWWDMSCII